MVGTPRIPADDRDYVFAGFELGEGIDVHFKAIIVVPPTDFVTVSVCDLLTVDVNVGLIEDAGETDVERAFGLVRGQVNLCAIPERAGKALAVLGADALGLSV